MYLNYFQWFQELSEHWENKDVPVPIFLIGTKKDLLADEETMKRLADANEKPVSMEEVF